MNQFNLLRSHQPELLSSVGGAAQGGSTKTKEEREALERKYQQRQGESSPSADNPSTHGPVGGKSDDAGKDPSGESGARSG